ncbi:hypothetical protein [Nonomuraea sp. B5E05]
MSPHPDPWIFDPPSPALAVAATGRDRLTRPRRFPSRMLIDIVRVHP